MTGFASAVWWNPFTWFKNINLSPGNLTCNNSYNTWCANSTTLYIQNVTSDCQNITSYAPCQYGCDYNQCLSQGSCPREFICMNNKTGAYRNSNCNLTNINNLPVSNT